MVYMLHTYVCMYVCMYVRMYVCTYALSVLFVYQLSCISECVFGLFFLQRDHSET